MKMLHVQHQNYQQTQDPSQLLTLAESIVRRENHIDLTCFIVVKLMLPIYHFIVLQMNLL